MASSDYDYIAFDNNGKPAANVDFGLIKIEPFKTRLCFHSPELWRENSSCFTKNVIAEFNEGDGILFDVEIVIQSVNLNNKSGIPYSAVKLFYCRRGNDYFGGIMCYGYLDYERYVANHLGIPEHCTVLGGSNTDENGKSINILWGYDPTKVFNDGKIFECVMPPEYQDRESFYAYCGVTQDMLDVFLTWDAADENWLKRIKENKPTITPKEHLLKHLFT